jgi:hypothetical protein
LKTELPINPEVVIEHLQGKYHDLADFIEYCKTQGLRSFRNAEMEFSFAEPLKEPVKSDTIQEKMPIPSGVPSNEDLLFASSETLEWKDPTKKGE